MINNPFKIKYRIVKDRYSGFEAQYKRWYFPFWLQCYNSNTSPTIEKARNICDSHSKMTVEYYIPGENSD